MTKEIEIPEGYEARIEGNKVIIEPKESKDERIRKRIILRLQYELEQNSNKFAKKEIPEEIAYLEKQKEHNLEDIEDDAVRKYMKLDKFALANMLAERDKTNAEVIETFESIEEQPTESEDERIRKKIIQFFKDASNGKTRVTTSGTFAKWAEFLEKQKSIKLSEEGEKILKGIIDGITNLAYPSNYGDSITFGGINWKDCVTFLKKLTIYNDIQKLM